MKTYTLLLLLFFFGMLGTATPSSVQEAPKDGQPKNSAHARIPAPATVPATGPPGTLEIAARAGGLRDSATETEQMIQSLVSVEELTPEIQDADRRHGELLALITSMTGADFVRLERLSRLQDQATLEKGRLEGIHERLTARLVKLGEIHETWTERRQLWRLWLKALDTDPDLVTAKPEIMASIQRIEQILEQATVAATLPQALQVEVVTLRAKFAQLDTKVNALQTRRRQALFQRTSPLLFSAKHRTQLWEGGWRAWDFTEGIDRGAYFVFARDNITLLGFLLFLALLIGGLARTGRLAATRKAFDEWEVILAHPWALGLFISVVVAMSRITLAPPLWDVLLWALYGGTAVLIGHRLVKVRALRRTIYLLAVFYPGLLLFEVAQLPDPVFRVGLAAVAAGSIPLFLHLARIQAQITDSVSGFKKAGALHTWPLRLGAGVWLWVFFALVVGYDALARWTVHATAMTAAMAFTAALSFALVQAAAETLARLRESGPILRRAGILVARQVISILRLMVCVTTVLSLLDTWGIADSPVATWQAMTNIGFKVGMVQMTVGRILLAVLVVYLAFIVSGFGRKLTAYRCAPETPTDGSDPRDHANQGLGESIARLAQYVFITLGFIFALAVLGVELKSFALIAGALGIGVGFGLQNMVNNFASGLILLFERPVRVGDTVVVGGVMGTIQQIGFRATVMLTLDQSEMIVPNGDLVTEKVINWTLTSPIARVFVSVGVAYGSPVAEVLEILSKAAFAHVGALKDPAPQALFMGFGESSLKFELRVWVQDVRMRMEMQSAVLADIDRRLREAGIEIPFPQRDLHLRSVDPEVLKQLTTRD